MSHRCTAKIEREHMEYEVEVEFTAHKGHKGFRNSLGVPEEPDEEPEIEIESVLYDGESFETTDKEDRSILEQCWDSLTD